MLHVLRTLFYLHGVLALAVSSSAQPAQQLSGVVRDTTFSVLPGVTVTVNGATTVSPRTVTTDIQGRYQLDALPAGRDLVTATLTGFDPQTIAVDVTGGPAVVDLVLPLSPLSERVTVTATRTGAADIQTTPLAVTTLAASTLDQMGVRTVEGLAGVVPSVTISQHTGAAQGLSAASARTAPSWAPIQVPRCTSMASTSDGRSWCCQTFWTSNASKCCEVHRHSLRPQLGRRHHQRRHATAGQRARDERPAHGWHLRHASG